MAKFNIGRDLTLTISVNGSVVNELGLLTETSFKADWSMKKVTPTNKGGITVARSIFGGYDVECHITRQDSTADDFFSMLEANWIAGGQDPDVTLLETVRNPDGSVDQYNYIDGTIAPEGDGIYKGLDESTMSVKFFFPQRQALTQNSQVFVGGGNGGLL